MESFGLFAGIVLLYVVFKVANTKSAKHLQSSVEMLCATSNVYSTELFDETASKYDVEDIKSLKAKANSLLD